jgi:SDR family mycofactocin-dependent oxidoreductase
MAGKLEGKVAFITGIAQGQGRSHAIRLAEEGADIIGVDSCEQFQVVPYPLPSEADLQQTVKEVEARGRKIVARKVDVRDLEGLQKAYDEGRAELGTPTIVVANAGIGPGGMATDDEQWEEVVSINMKGVWNTVRVSLDPMIENGQGGSMILTSSAAGMSGNRVNIAGMIAYTAAKHGVVGLTRMYANIAAQHNIRVNSVAPTTVNTPMTTSLTEDVFEFMPELGDALKNALPVFKIEPEDVTGAVLWLASDDSRYVTGTVVPVDAGMLVHR